MSQAVFTASQTIIASDSRSVEQIAAEEANHWNHLGRKRKHRSYVVHTKASPLRQPEDVIPTSLQALARASEQELLCNQWSGSDDTPRVEEVSDESDEVADLTEDHEKAPSSPKLRKPSQELERSGHQMVEYDRVADPQIQPSNSRTILELPIQPNNSRTILEMTKTFQAYFDSPIETSTENPDLKMAMLGVAIAHLVLILGTVMLITCLAIHGSGGSGFVTLSAVIGIVVIVMATLKVNRYILTAALYLMLPEQRK